MALLVFGALGLTMISVAGSALFAAGRPGLSFALAGPLVPLAICAHLAGIPRFGPLGAAAATTGLSWLGATATTLAVYRVWHVLPSAATLGRSVLVSTLAFALAAFWPAPGLLLLLKLPAVGSIVVLAFVLLGEFRGRELSLIRSLLNRQPDLTHSPGGL